MISSHYGILAHPTSISKDISEIFPQRKRECAPSSNLERSAATAPRKRKIRGAAVTRPGRRQPVAHTLDQTAPPRHPKGEGGRGEGGGEGEVIPFGTKQSLALPILACGIIADE